MRLPRSLMALLVLLLAPVLGVPLEAMASPPTAHAARATPRPAAGALVANGGFEGGYAAVGECANVTGEQAPGWADNTCWDSERPVVDYGRDTADPHSGAAAQRVTLVSGRLAQFGQFLDTPLADGTRYTVTWWMRADRPVTVATQLRQQGAPYTSWTSALSPLTTRWHRFSLDGFVEGGSVALLAQLTTPGTFWLDDVSISATPGAPVGRPVPRQPVPRAYVGVHLNTADTPWPAVPQVGSVRVWDADRNADGTGTGAQWAEVNPARGTYDWSGLDRRVATARRHRAEVLYVLGGRTPRWASGQPDAVSPYGPGQCAEPRSLAVWADWVRAVAERYRGVVRDWEVWNEADLTDFYCGSPDELVQLARTAARVLRAVDPANRVHSPGFSGAFGPGHLAYFLSHGGAAVTDVVDYHCYATLPEANVGIRTANLVAAVDASGGAGKPLWDTEQGWFDGVTDPVTQARGAGYLARAYLLNWSAGFTRFHYYSWDDRVSLPLVGADRAHLTRAGVAYREVASWMVGQVMESATVESGVWTVTLRAPDGSRRHAVWSTAAPVTVPVPVAWGATEVRDLGGGSAPLSPNGIRVTGSPVLVG